MPAIVNPNTTMFQQPPPPPTQNKSAKPLYFASGLFALIMVVLMILWCIRYQGGYSWGNYFLMFRQWNWHATLTMFGFSIFLAESILVFRINKRTSERASKITHVIMNLIGFVLTTVGLAAMFTINNSGVYESFFSFHSWIGITTYVLFIGQFTCGILTHLIPILPRSLGSYHRQCGIAIYILAVLSVATGIMLKATLTASWYASLDSEGIVINFMGFAFVIFSVLVLYIVINPEYK